MNDLIKYTDDGDTEQSEFHDLELDEIGSAACEALKAASEARNKWIEGRNEWIEETLRLARLLVEGRERFPSNEAFGNWIDGIRGLSLLSHQDRAALIQFGKWPAVTRDVLEKTRRNSWREIWDKEAKRVLEPSERPKKSRVTRAGKTDDDEVDEVDDAESGGPPLLNLVEDAASDIVSDIMAEVEPEKAFAIAKGIIDIFVAVKPEMAMALANGIIEACKTPLTTRPAAEPAKRRRGRPKKVATK